MSKFGNLSIATDKTSRMSIFLPNEIEPLLDQDGNEAYIDFLPWDSEPGRRFEQEQNRAVVSKSLRQRGRAELADSVNVIKDQAERLAVLATGWHLVDHDRSVIDLPFSRANVLELFTEPGMAWLRRQAWIFVSNEQNFMPRSSKSSAPSPSTNSGSGVQAEPAAPNAIT